MKDVVGTLHRLNDAAPIAHITQVEPQLGVHVLGSNIILLLLVPAEYADFGNVRVKESTQDCVSE
jgi:hypothetical protein